MGRKVKVPEYELLDYLGSKDKPFPNAEIGDYFGVCKMTAREAAKRARKNGHPIIPTGEGQWLIKRITTAEQLIAVQNAIGWASDLRKEVGRIVSIASDVKDTASKRVERIAEQQTRDGA
jgi:hypothetical protein